MMMLFIILAVVCLSTANPLLELGVNGFDGVEGVLYDFPEYEDPDMAMLQLSAMGAMPVLTILEVAREPEDSPKPGDSTYHDQLIDLLKKNVDDVIARLRVARSKLEKGNTNIFTDVDKSIYYLKNIELLLHTNPSSFEDDSATPSPTDDIGSNNSSTTIGEAPSSSQATTSAETPKIENSYVQKKMLSPFGDSVLITETNKYEGGEKAVLHKKWTWKSSSIV